jgi:hypothetical protein
MRDPTLSSLGSDAQPSHHITRLMGVLWNQ